MEADLSDGVGILRLRCRRLVGVNFAQDDNRGSVP